MTQYKMDTESNTAKQVPGHTLDALRRYVEDRIPTGGFLRAVLSNDLKGAFAQADGTNRAALYEIVMCCTWDIPGIAWGSREAYLQWLKGEEQS